MQRLVSLTALLFTEAWKMQNSSGQYPFYLINDQNTVKALTLSNFFSDSLIVGGCSKILRKKGDAF